MIGQTISHYRILEKLGEGGMGVVYKAEDTTLDRVVALKFLPPHLSASEQDKARFIQEAKAASAINHPNICTIYSIDAHDNQLFIAMEFVEGQTLREKTSGVRAGNAQPLQVKQAIDIGIQIAEGLAAAHEKGIVHRDIKPENIMVRKDGIALIMDFGLAKLQGVSSLTKEGSTVGTAGYMSPEQVQGHETDHRSDIFSFGVVLYELCTGQLPFRGVHETALLYEIVNVDAPPMSSVKPEIDPALDAIVLECLEKNPNERTQSVRQVAIDLRRLKPGSSGKRSDRTSTHNVIPPRPSPSKSHLTRVISLVALLVIAALAAWYLYSGREHRQTIESLAVLPFANTSGDPDMEYLSDGITESLINGLSQVSNLTVMSRSSVFRYKGNEVDPQKAGQELGVKAVLTGRVTQRGENLTISTELVNVSNNSHIWGNQYNRKFSDILAIQEEISREISGNLSIKLGGEDEKKLTKRSTENTEAYQLYLKGRFHWNKRRADDFYKAVEYFKQAIGKDPGYALAYAGLASTYALMPEYAGVPTREYLPKTEEMAKKASELDPLLAESFAVLGLMKANYQWDWDAAENYYRQAIALNPNYPTTRHWYSICLRNQGKLEEALAEIRRAQELDPLSLIINSNVAQSLALLGRTGEALEQNKKIVELDPNFPGAHQNLAMIYIEEGNITEAIRQGQVMRDILGPENPRGLETLSYVYARAGMKHEAMLALNQLLEFSKKGYANSVQVAMVYAGLGEKDKAFEWLEKGYNEQNSSLGNLKVGRAWKGLHSDPRYLALLKKMGLDK